MPHPGLRWDGRRLHILDQTLLPHEERWIELTSAAETAGAIKRLAVRGAPLIGIAAAYGLAVEVSARPGLGVLEDGWSLLREARPTAVNLAWAVDRVRAACLQASVATMGSTARAEAQVIHAEEDAASAAIGERGAELLAERGATRLLTHCNAGALATGGTGSALAVVQALHERTEGGVHVFVDETRPLLQGARLTVWELARAGIPHTLIPDVAAAGLIARGEVDAVVTGADRIAANGDVCNKVGTYGVALAAHAAGIPFVVAAPRSTLDPGTPSGDAIPIEERDADEVRRAGGALVTLPGTPVRNPAFDVTPAHLVTAVVTE
jgi:methylthioribose-1-phosphate isomerase